MIPKIFASFLLGLLLLANLASPQTATPTPVYCCQVAPQWTPTLLSPCVGLAVDREMKRIYATQYSTNQVHAFDYNGQPIPAFAGGALTVTEPFEVAVDCFDSSVLVVQRGLGLAAVTKWDKYGNSLWTFPPTFYGDLRYACVDEWGNVYVSSETHGIYLLDRTGVVRGNIDSTSVPGGLNAPTGVCAVGLDLYVADTLNYRILHYDRPDPLSYSFTYAGAVTLSVPPYGLAYGVDGKFYVASEAGNGYGVFDQAFQPLTTWCVFPLTAGAYGIATDEDGNVFIASQPNSAIAKMRPCFDQPHYAGCPAAYRGTDPPALGAAFVFPSPVRGDQARLSFRMKQAGRMQLRVWNRNGELAASLEVAEASGLQTAPIDLTGFAPGVYFYSVTLRYDSGGEEKIPTQKFAVIR